MAQIIVDIVTRSGKGSPLTISEMDKNLTNLRDAIKLLSSNVASSTADGLLSYTDKKKLDSIESGATKYSHPITNGYKHLPAITVPDVNKFVKSISSDGSSIWSDINWTDIKNKPTFGSASVLNVPVSGDASANQVVLGNDSRLAFIENLASNTFEISNVVGLQSALDTLTSTISSNKTDIESKLSLANAQLLILSGISTEFNSVKTEFNTLKNSVNASTSTVTNLQGQFDVLSSSVTDLETSVNDLLASGGTGGGSIMYERATGTTVTVGGMPSGTLLNGTTVQDVLDKMLYPYQTPTFTSFAVPSTIATNALGSTVQGTYNFTWSISNSNNIATNTISIIDVTGANSLASGIANDGSEQVTIGPYTYSTSTTHTFRITAIDIKGTTISRDVSIKWSPTIYYGESALATMTANDILGLRAKEQTTTVNKTFAFQAGGYKWLCYPKSFGLKTTFKDASNNFDVSMNPVVTISLNGTDFYCHRTYNTLGGSINIIVS